MIDVSYLFVYNNIKRKTALKHCKLIIYDEVNVKFDDVDSDTRSKLHNALKFEIPGAKYMKKHTKWGWDGKISFCTAGGMTYMNLLDRLFPILESSGYDLSDIEIVDHRSFYDFQFPEISETMFAHKVWPEGHNIAGEPIILRDYQVQAIRDYLTNLHGIQEISTGAGKTLLTACLSSLIEPYGRSIVIVPNKDLVMQTEEDYINLGLDVGVFFGDRKEWNHKHTICTWQSLAVFSKRTKNHEVVTSINEFLKDVICVMIDESHTIKGKELRDLLCGTFANVPIRWGMTGTVPLEEHEYICLLAAVGQTVGEIKASELQEKNVLANCEVNIIQLEDSDHVECSNYISEHSFLLSDVNRLEQIANMIVDMSSSGNTLVLVERIEAVEILNKLIPNSVFLYGKIKGKKRKEEYKSFQSADGKILIATFGIAAVGINIPRIFNLVLIEPGKAFVRVIQSIGRGLRRAHDKDFINIVDICSSLKFSKRHLAKRKTFYKKAGYPYNFKTRKYLTKY